MAIKRSPAGGYCPSKDRAPSAPVHAAMTPFAIAPQDEEKPTTAGKAWSSQQIKIYDWFKSGKGHLVVRARAGTGKTTSIIEAISRAPESSILLAAFNKRIAVELQERLTNPNAVAATLHSVGYGCIRRYWDNTRMDNDRGRRLSDEVCGNRAPDQVKRLVTKLHTFAREIDPHAVKGAELRDMAVAFDCTPDDEWDREGYGAEWVCDRAVEAMVVAAESKPANGIDFADMVYLPIRNRWLRGKYDLVVIDEGQDMNAAQLEIAQGVLNPGGRMVIVGDDRQALYGFRGADTGSLDRLKKELKAQELGLTTTYRCGRAIVEEAQKIVPDIQAREGAHAGVIRTTSIDKAIGELAPGDYLLSRTNAPLIKVALTLIRAGRRARVEGRDIGAGLKAITRKLATGDAAHSIPAWLKRLTVWREREVTRAESRNLQGKIDHLFDQEETLLALADGAGSVREIEARIDTLFGDNGGAYIVCSSIHKAKGLEAETVFLLRDTLNLRVSCECGHRHFNGNQCSRCQCSKYRPRKADALGESNIVYVGVTRAKNELVWVSGVR